MADERASAAPAAVVAAGGLEVWIAQQSQEATPAGWTVLDRLHGLRFGV